jgi:Protein of unknown function (DUF1097)
MIFNRSRLVFGLVVLACIVVTEFVAAYLKVPAWPAYIAWVLFFIEGMNPKKVPSILVGAAVGIGLILLAPYAIGFFAQWLGPDWGRLIYVLLAVYSIFAFGEVIPLLLNNYTFMFVTVAAIALGAPNPNPALWLVVAVVGGGLLIGGILMIGRWMGASTTTHTQKAETLPPAP